MLLPYIFSAFRLYFFLPGFIGLRWDIFLMTVIGTTCFLCLFPGCAFLLTPFCGYTTCPYAGYYFLRRFWLMRQSKFLRRKRFFFQTTDKPTIFRWVFVVYIRFLIIVDKKCISLFQRIFAIFFMFCTAAVSKHCSETLSFPRIRQ